MSIENFSSWMVITLNGAPVLPRGATVVQSVVWSEIIARLQKLDPDRKTWCQKKCRNNHDDYNITLDVVRGSPSAHIIRHLMSEIRLSLSRGRIPFMEEFQEASRAYVDERWVSWIRNIFINGLPGSDRFSESIDAIASRSPEVDRLARALFDQVMPFADPAVGNYVKKVLNAAKQCDCQELFEMIRLRGGICLPPAGDSC